MQTLAATEPWFGSRSFSAHPTGVSEPVGVGGERPSVTPGWSSAQEILVLKRPSFLIVLDRTPTSRWSRQFSKKSAG